ncbi:MAG TPA: hypothetical protein VN667_22085 [Burkholderiales bacterium]|nr:hypothetical protein [Burkholderiales bacterium]
MSYQLTLTDFDWLKKISAAADADRALGGVPLGVAARLTGFQLVTWISQSGMTISRMGRDALARTGPLAPI